MSYIEYDNKKGSLFYKIVDYFIIKRNLFCEKIRYSLFRLAERCIDKKTIAKILEEERIKQEAKQYKEHVEENIDTIFDAVNNTKVYSFSLEDRVEELDNANKVLAKHLWHFYYLYQKNDVIGINNLFEELGMYSCEDNRKEVE